MYIFGGESTSYRSENIQKNKQSKKKKVIYYRGNLHRVNIVFFLFTAIGGLD